MGVDGTYYNLRTERVETLRNDSAVRWIRAFLRGWTEGRNLVQGQGLPAEGCFPRPNALDSLWIRGLVVGLADDHVPGPSLDTRDNGTHG